MSKFSINLTNDLSDRFAAWAERYVSQTSLRRYERACAWVMDDPVLDPVELDALDDRTGISVGPHRRADREVFRRERLELERDDQVALGRQRPGVQLRRHQIPQAGLRPIKQRAPFRRHGIPSALMASPLFAMMARSIAASGLAEPALLETRALAMLPTAVAPDLDKGDLIFIDGTLYHVRTALKDGAAQTKLVLELPQWRTVDRGGESFRIAFAGDIEQGDAAVAICKATVSILAGD